MTAKQYVAALERLGLTQAGAADMLGLYVRTSRRYVSGDSEIPGPVAKLLRLAIAGKITVDDIAKA